MPITINGKRLWDNLMRMAKIGGTRDGGCNRQALTDLDIEGRALFQSWCSEIGLVTRFDAVGNMFARMPGKDENLPALVMGSHLDTQPTGGKFDGILGVLAGLEVSTRLTEEGVVPARPVEIACWMNEEGARFAPAMMGSGVWAGVLDLDTVRLSTGPDGITLGEGLDRHGLSGEPRPGKHNIAAYLELHIEQGPVLEAEEVEIGVVTGAQGIRWYELSLNGQEIHAGPSPMALRHDPVTMLPELISGIMRIGTRDDASRATIGQITTRPYSRNVVPGSVLLSVDLRHPDEDTLAQMDKELKKLVDALPSSDTKLGSSLKQIWHSPVVAFDDRLIRAVRHGATAHGYRHRDIVSGAGHDALMVARKAPTTMIFIPCRDGISHNPAEHIEPEQAQAGANVLLATVLDYTKG